MSVPHLLLSPLPFTAWGAAEDLTAPASYLNESARPFLKARAAAASLGRWYVDFGSATPVAVLALGNANFATLAVSSATDGGYSFASVQSGLALTRDPRTGRRSGFFVLSIATATTLRLDGSALDAGETAYALGTVVCGAVARPFSDYPEWPVRFTVTTPAAELTDADSGRVLDVNEEGRPFIELRLQGRFDARTAILADLQALAAQPPDVPFVFCEGLDHTERTYVVRRTEDTTISETPGLVEVDIGLRECV